MNERRFYHRAHQTLALLLALFWLIPSVSAQERLALPPRSIDDIAKLLDHYKPDPAATARLIAEADAHPPETSDRDALFRFYWRRSSAARGVGRIHQEVADLRKAAEYGQKFTNDYIFMLRNLASAETFAGNFLAGLRLLEEGLRLIPPNMHGQLLPQEQAIAGQYAVLGDFEAAKAHLREAEGSFTLLRQSPRWDEWGQLWTALVERGRGEVFRAEGRLVEAEGAFRKALNANARFLKDGESRPIHGVRVQSQITQMQFREVIERSLAMTLLAQGKVVEAEIFSRQALRHSLERVGRGTTDSATSLMVLAGILAEQGRNAEAARLAKASIDSYEMAGVAPESFHIARARKALAGVLVSEGQYVEAMGIFQAMKDGLKKDPELLKKIGAGDLDWVLAMLRTGDRPGAERMAKIMLDNATLKFGENALHTSMVRAFYAMALAARGEREGALKMFRAAVPILLDRARSDAEAETGTFKRQQRLVTILESYMRLLSETGQPGDHAGESFRLADIARNSIVQRALTASAARANIADPKLAVLARREQDAQRRINALSEVLTQLLGAPPDQQLPKIQAKMREDIESLQRERQSLKREIASSYPDYAELVDPKPATVAEVSGSLRPGEVLLAFYFGEEASFAWAVRPDGKAAFVRVALTHAGLEKSVAGLRKALDPRASSIDEIPPFDVGAAQDLYRKLLAPLESSWQDAKVLLVVPHADLGQLPLALLPTASIQQPGKTDVPFAGYKGVPWLMRKVAIAQLPSVTALASLRRLPAGKPSRRPFVGFGDPLFSRAQALQAESHAAAAVRLRSLPRTEGMGSASLALLPRLPDTGDEVREIARALKADPDRDVFLQAKATEQAVLEADLSDRRVVMFATHGLVPGDLDGLAQPALALTSPEVAGEGDGLLAMDEILGLRLDADWVVLSACNTAAGHGQGTEAVSGLGRAFFYAGARALLASNWPVETASARNLMTDLFRRHEGAHHSKAEALRQAMLTLADGPGAVDARSGKPLYSYAHPLFWAPFVVIGD